MAFDRRNIQTSTLMSTNRLFRGHRLLFHWKMLPSLNTLRELEKYREDQGRAYSILLTDKLWNEPVPMGVADHNDDRIDRGLESPRSSSSHFTLASLQLSLSKQA